MRTDILDKKEEILKWIEEEKPKNFICQQLNCRQSTLNNYLIKMNIEYKGQQNKKGQHKGSNIYRPASYYFDNIHPIHSYRLKEKIIKDGLKENRCEICGCSIWQGVMLPLELHHKDGNHNNNNFNNLQILCPNCHSIQEGNSGANIGKYAVVQEQVDYSHLECEANNGIGVQISATAPELQKSKLACIKCGKEITNRSKTGMCLDCYSFSTRKTERPSREELKKLIRSKSFLEIGRLFQVTDNAVRKWCKGENLPSKKAEINSYSDEEWANI